MFKTNKKLKELRESLNYSQEYVAKQMNLPSSEIEAIESGQRKATADELMILTEIYGITTKELLPYIDLSRVPNHKLVREGQ